MLTLIISTQRTGSTSLLRNMDGNIWMPNKSMHKFELFNFSNVKEVNTRQLELYYLSLLLDHLEKNPNENTLVKVLVDQVSTTTMKCLIKNASSLHHPIRLDYKSQLSSLICASNTSSWYERSKVYTVELTQDDIDIGHDYLSNKIIQHSKLYRKYNGQLHILEKREKRPYTTQQIIENNLSWPNFDTAAQFL